MVFDHRKDIMIKTGEEVRVSVKILDGAIYLLLFGKRVYRLVKKNASSNQILIFIQYIHATKIFKILSLGVKMHAQVKYQGSCMYLYGRII